MSTRPPARPARHVRPASAAACAAGLLLLAAPPALAQDIPGSFSGYVTFTTDYVFRGISQTDEQAAVQASVILTLDSGFYASIWGSNVDFNEAAVTDGATAEFDFSVGYAGETGIEGLTFDIGVLYYYYPGADDDLEYNYVEGYGKLTFAYDRFTLTGGLFASPEFFGTEDAALYYTGGVKIVVVEGVSVSGNLGYQTFQDEVLYPDDILDYNFGATVSAAGFDVDLRYHGNDTDDEDYPADVFNERFVLSVTRAF